MTVQILQAQFPGDLPLAQELFQAYADSLGVDLGFQKFDEELAGLPGAYAPPQGRLLLARMAGEAVGCVALKPLQKHVCEMKRLFIYPAYRKEGAGRLLAEAIIGEARAIGYRSMLLDSLPSMQAAQGLYGKLGFREIPAYYETPVQGTTFMKLQLTAP